MYLFSIMFSDHNGIKLKINNRKIIRKSPYIQKLSNILLNNPWDKEKVRKYFKFNDNQKMSEMQLKRKAEQNYLMSFCFNKLGKEQQIS